MSHAAARAAAAVLAELPPPDHSFASDNTAGAHPSVLDAIVEANTGHAPAYGADRWTAALEDRLADLFGTPVTIALCFGGTGANVVALHTMCGKGSRIFCAEDAHIVLDEAGAPEHITGAELIPLRWHPAGKLTPEAVRAAAERHARTGPDGGDVLSVTQATEVGTVYTFDELAALCDTARAHDMTVHLDGARLTNALVAWGYGPERLAEGCRALAATGVDAIAFGGTKAGLLGAEALVFCNREVAGPVVVRRKQVTQTASKMRFLSAQLLAGLDGGALLAWSGQANAMARRLADALDDVPGVELGYPVDANVVFATLPPAAAAALAGWTPFFVWDPERYQIRFVTSWDTTDTDVDRLAAGIRAAATAARAGGRTGAEDRDDE
jgi:threonine aldolase